MRGNDLRGRGISTAVTLYGGHVLPLCFCFQTFAAAEDMYNDVLKHEGDIGDIIDAWASGSLAAVMSLIYGAAVAADSDMTLDAFVRGTSDDETRQCPRITQCVRRCLNC